MLGTGRSENMEVEGSKTVDGVRQLHYIPINISVHQPKNRNLRGDTNANDLELREVVGMQNKLLVCVYSIFHLEPTVSSTTLNVFFSYIFLK